MPAHSFNAGILIALAGLTHAHMASWYDGMYCKDGNVSGVINYNNNEPTKPLYNLTYDQFWMHAVDGCDKFAPAEGEFLEIQSGGCFTVELAGNRAFTTLNPSAHVTAWGDGKEHPDNYSVTNFGDFPPTPSGCISSPNLHTQNETMAAGTAFAISYESDITKVTPDNLVVFTVRYHTPWKRVVTYEVPPGMPPCPNEGCIVVWGWVPNGCGQANIYLFPGKAQVKPDPNSPVKKLGTPRAPVWCEEDEGKCVKGPKQVLIWHQAERNNIEVEGYDLSGNHKSPAYNMECGFKDGAQTDIFEDWNQTNSSAHSKRMMRRGKNMF